MNIGVLGYYGFGNVGDEVILETIRDFLKPHRVVPLPVDFDATPEALDRLNAFDFLVLGGGGLYNRQPTRPFDTFDRWANHLKTPIGVLGLGVETLDRAFVPATHRLVDQAKFFVVRDDESKTLINHPRVEVAPDLTFYRPLPISSIDNPRQDPVCGVNFRAPMGGGSVSGWVRTISALPCRKRGLPFSTVPTYDDRETLLAIDPDCPHRLQPSVYQSLDTVIASAFHAVVFAIQSGVPAIAINYHSKVRRIMEEAGLEDYVLEWDEWEALPSYYDRLFSSWAEIRGLMVDYTRYCQARLQEAVAQVKETINGLELSRFNGSSNALSEPKVTVVVGCVERTAEVITKTVDTCLRQTHSNLDVVLVGSDCGLRSLNFLADPRASCVELGPIRADWVAAGLAQATGDYVTWIHAGVLFADDAVSLLVARLHKDPAAILVFADFFLAAEGRIERRVKADAYLRIVGTEALWHCFLLRRYAPAMDVLYHLTSNNLPEDWSRCLMHISLPLLYEPATEQEINLHRSAIQFGRGQVQQARDSFVDAMERCVIDPREREKVFRTFLEIAHNPRVVADPIEFLETVRHNLPADTPELRAFKKWFCARSCIEQAYLLRERGHLALARRQILRGILSDLRWLRNRGILSFLMRTIVTPFAPQSSYQLGASRIL